MKKQLEYNLQKQVCLYLNQQYPNILYCSDTIASLKLTMPQASRNKAIQKHNFKCPDLMIFESRGRYNGLFIELKIESPYKKNGDLKSNKHLQDQDKSMSDLRMKGYKALFSVGFNETKKIIDDYMKLEGGLMLL